MTPALAVAGRAVSSGEPVELTVDAGRLRLGAAGGSALRRDLWLAPGLVDAHCHVGLGAEGGVGPDEQEQQARADRDAGVLLIRDCGVPVDTRWIDDRPDLPRIIRAGRHLARPRRYIRDVGVELEPEQLPAAAAEQARTGDGWVKLVGDWIDRDLGDLAPCWPAEALAAAVAAAHREGARVTAHIFGEDGLDDLLAAGVDCIEHGTGLSDDQLARMAAQGVALVPTLINIATFPDIAARASRFPTYAAHMLALHERAAGVVRRAHEAGVAVYAGTDAGGGIAHGRIADEVVALAAAGLPTVDALAAASWRARAWLGRPAELEDGAPADVVGYDRDPREDPTVLRDPALIVLRGEVTLAR
jgi:imidazolonepropionase-like amidohydrolase